MKKIAVSVIKLIIINIALNLIINVVKYLLDVEINEIVEISTSNREEYDLITDILRKLDIEWSEQACKTIIIRK